MPLQQLYTDRANKSAGAKCTFANSRRSSTKEPRCNSNQRIAEKAISLPQSVVLHRFQSWPHHHNQHSRDGGLACFTRKPWAAVRMCCGCLLLYPIYGKYSRPKRDEDGSIPARHYLSFVKYCDIPKPETRTLAWRKSARAVTILSSSQ